MPASAQQPLERFIASASDQAVQSRLAAVRTDESRAARTEAGAALLPSVSISGGYTRNQQAVEATFPGPDGAPTTATITARDQLDATVRADLVLVDVPAWSRYLSAVSELRGAQARQIAVQTDIHERVVAAWHRLAAARAVTRASIDARQTAEESLDAVSTREEAGLASVLDVQRARADVGRARQELARAELDRALAERQLTVLTGLPPEDIDARLADGVAEEAPLGTWLELVPRTPQVRQAGARRDARAHARAAQRSALLPTLGAFAAERYSNAAGFGPEWLWSAGVELTWRLDPLSFAEGNTAARRARVAELEVEQARQDATTRIHGAWHRARSLLEAARATRLTEEAASAAARTARSRFEAGTASPLELSQAERDRSSATVDRIRAEADLRAARLRLRLYAGLPPELEATP